MRFKKVIRKVGKVLLPVIIATTSYFITDSAVAQETDAKEGKNKQAQTDTSLESKVNKAAGKDPKEKNSEKEQKEKYEIGYQDILAGKSKKEFELGTPGFENFLDKTGLEKSWYENVGKISVTKKGNYFLMSRDNKMIRTGRMNKEFEKILYDMHRAETSKDSFKIRKLQLKYLSGAGDDKTVSPGYENKRHTIRDERRVRLDFGLEHLALNLEFTRKNTRSRDSNEDIDQYGLGVTTRLNLSDVFNLEFRGGYLTSLLSSFNTDKEIGALNKKKAKLEGFYIGFESGEINLRNLRMVLRADYRESDGRIVSKTFMTDVDEQHYPGRRQDLNVELETVMLDMGKYGKLSLLGKAGFERRKIGPYDIKRDIAGGGFVYEIGPARLTLGGNYRFKGKYKNHDKTEKGNREWVFGVELLNLKF
ncbi:hypothetical protein KY317_00440 [Candidatus Woesearchaeota archaeon]|nr:hypothetical protein [Candidatus Woesearchaeota archaeon]